LYTAVSSHFTTKAAWCWRWGTIRRDDVRKNNNNVQCVIVGSYLGFSFLYPCHNLLCTSATTIICFVFGPTQSSGDLLWKLKTFILHYVFSAVSKTVTDASTQVFLILDAFDNIIYSYTSQLLLDIIAIIIYYTNMRWEDFCR